MGRNVVIQATLKDQDGNPVANKTINFYYRVSGETTWNNAGSDTTDNNGVASVTVNLDVPQTYDFRAEFTGDEDYEPSSAELDNVKVKAKTTITLEIIPQ